MDMRYELVDRIRPYCMFVAAVDRALIKTALEDGGPKVLNYVPNNFHEAPRLLIEARRAGINMRVTPHRLRASVVTLLLDADMPPDQVQKFLRHKRITTT
jgi:integrase